MKKGVSARDVAERAGVSRTTVSFVLNNTEGAVISEETRARVLRAARELGYVPNEQARSLSMTRHHTIGLFISHLRSPFSDSFILPLIDGISRVLNKHRFQLVLQQVGTRESDYQKLIAEDDVDGVILVNPHHEDAAFERLLDTAFPTVVIGAGTSGKANEIDVDNFAAAKEATEHLLSLGHRRIGFISHAPLDYPAAAERRRGYLQALESAGAEPASGGEALERTGSFSEESGYRCAGELLSLASRPTAIFAGNDMIAYGVMQAVRDAGLRIPGDVSIVGFDDNYLSRFTNPPMTTVAVPAASLGAEAARIAVESITESRAGSPARLVLSHHLSVRRTTGRPSLEA